MEAEKKLELKVFSYMEKHHMLEPGDRVIAGISGGADSVCLLFLLLEWAKQMPLEIGVVHVNHGLREEAKQDVSYVQGLCETHGLPFFLTEVKIAEIAAREKCSTEEAGRRVRYEAFEHAAKEFGAGKIAVAHNANDRGETMLFHLFRGTGIRGLGSIRPVRDRIIRPLLCLERREIEGYLQGKDIRWCEDVSNATDTYTRNRIRHHILNYAEENVAAGCVFNMGRTAELLAETEDYLEQETGKAREKSVYPLQEKQKKGIRFLYGISVKEMNVLHPALQKRVLLNLIQELAPGGKDISFQHIADLLELITEPGNRHVDLPFGIFAEREYNRVLLGIVRGEPERTGVLREGEAISLTVDLPDLADENEGKIPQNRVRCYTLENGGILQLEVAKIDDFLKNEGKVPQNRYTKWLDYDKMKKPLILRTRQTGDYLTISDGAGGIRHKSLKDYLITEKIPARERDRLPVLAEDQHVLWLVGRRISEYYKITADTKNVLKIQLTGTNFPEEQAEENHGRAY